MVKSFLTLEDINTTIYNNQYFYFYEIDVASLFDSTTNFDWIKLDFVEIKRQHQSSNLYKIDVKVNSSNWTKGVAFVRSNGDLLNPYYFQHIEDGFTAQYTYFQRPVKILLYMGVSPVSEQDTVLMYKLKKDSMSLNLKELNNLQDICILTNLNHNCTHTIQRTLEAGYNLIEYNGSPIGYLFVNLLKSDFQFQCTQTLILGKVNTVRLNASSDYKPNGDMVGEYMPAISVKYKDKTLPVEWNAQLDDYTFDIDLINQKSENDVVLTVTVEANEVLNSSETEIKLHTMFETINTESKLVTLFSNGGVGRLGSDLILTNDLNLVNDVYLIGNDYTLDLDGYKINVNSEHTFKASKTNFVNGENTIQQNLNSKVEATECTFTNCTGLGSVIDCQLNLESLNNPTDFTTTLTKCTFNNCDTMILHSGELSVTDCTVNSTETKVSNPNYPFFLYQTDGNATILQSEFNYTPNSEIDTDIEFNSCIFTCGEFAQINGLSHSELQSNDIESFLETQRNRSKINVTYYYPLIEDYIILKSDNGYCHTVSDVDFVFKTKVKPQRRD